MTGRVLPAVLGPPRPVRLSSGLLALLAAIGLSWLAAQRRWHADVAPVPFLAAAVVFMGFVPGLVRRARRLAGRRRPMVPYLPLMGLAYAVYYGLPGLLLDQDSGITDNADALAVRDALGLSLAGFGCLLLGHAGLASVPKRASRWCLDLCPVRARRLAALFLGAGAVATTLRSDGSGQLLELVRRLAEIGLGVLLVLALRGQLPGRWRLMLKLAIPGYLFLQIGTGSVAQLMLPCAFFAMVTWGARHRVPVGLIVGMGLVAVLLRGNVDAFRNETWHGEGRSASSAEKSDRFVRMLGDQLGSGEATLGGSMVSVLARVNFTVLFAMVVERTPQEVPYWDGESYATLLTSLVPRVLWADKPRKDVGQEFGHRYGILAPSDDSTSINLPQLIELYANFGTLGVLIGMLLFGVLYGLLDRLLNSPGAGDGMLVLSAAIFSRLLNIESDFSLVYGAIPYHIVAFYLLLSIARQRPAPALQ